MKAAATREKMIEILNQKYPKLLTRTTEDFDGGEGGIWSSAEDGLEAKDGFRLFDYYNQDFKEVRYILCVHKEIHNLLRKNGWYAQFHDAGTVMFYLI